MQPIQSWLFVPGHRQSMVDKALTLDVDALIFDLEDGVPPSAKETARQQITTALASPSGTATHFVRTHAATSPNIATDLESIIRPGLTGLILPKVNDAKDIIHIAAALSKRERQTNLPTGQLRLLALIESALGLTHAPAIAASDPRMAGLIFGAEDFALDLSADPHDDFLYARSALVVAAASAGIQAIDRAHLDLDDADGLLESTRRARQMGFSGKILIHPKQITPIHDAFCPSPEEVDYAQRVLEAFTENSGSIVVDGRMVDLPVVERARQTLSLYKRRI